jgi:hypothetical protein
MVSVRVPAGLLARIDAQPGKRSEFIVGALVLALDEQDPRPPVDVIAPPPENAVFDTRYEDHPSARVPDPISQDLTTGQTVRAPGASRRVSPRQSHVVGTLPKTPKGK